MVENDLQTIKDKIRQLESGSDVSTAVGKGPSGTFARPPSRIGIRPTTSLCRERWNSKDGSQNTLLPRAYGDRGVKLHKGLAPRQNKEHGQQKLWSVCGSAMKPSCRRWSGCRTSSKKNSRKSPTNCAVKWSHVDWR